MLVTFSYFVSKKILSLEKAKTAIKLLHFSNIFVLAQNVFVDTILICHDRLSEYEVLSQAIMFPF